MLTVIWHYEVAAEREEAFLRAYGHAGPWRRYFKTCEGYQGSKVFKSLERPGEYVVHDEWDGLAEYAAAVEAEAYKELLKAEPLYLRERRIGRVDGEW